MDLALLLPTVACGVLGTLALRASDGLRRGRPTLLAAVLFVGATVGLGRLTLTSPVGAVYAVWAGLAAVTLLVVDRLVFREQLRAVHVAGVLVVLAGVVVIDLQQ
ncbi:multidrug transporter [Marmoricola endophyticus]|uniref:Multidrug transporter n=1 Tax=Marmoricola endophyticus TaxID=2040280 RepID=A0A917BMV5_9ACTN|nr:SMR family transporter [Marmoricola endophyticus]GGF49947.1 multidrug transporter [Marmoricola endophyticus]